MSDEQVVEVDEFATANPSLGGEMTVTIALSDRTGGTDLFAVHGGLPHGPCPDNGAGWRMALGKPAARVEAVLADAANPLIDRRRASLLAPQTDRWRRPAAVAFDGSARRGHRRRQIVISSRLTLG